VAGFLAAAEAEGAIGETINLGVGAEISIGDLAQLIARLLGRGISIQCEDIRLRPSGSEVERLLSDNAKARRLLGWQPRVTLEEGLQRTIAWLKENGHRIRTSSYVV